MKDIVTPVPPEEVKGVIRKCLEQAAQLNYQRITEYAKIEGKQKPSITQWLMAQTPFWWYDTNELTLILFEKAKAQVLCESKTGKKKF